MTPNWTWTFKSQKSLYIHLVLTHKGQIVVRFALRLVVSEIYVQVVKNRKCTEWPQTEYEHLTVKSTLYTLNTYPLRFKFSSVSLYDELFPRYKVFKNRKCTVWPQTELEHLTGKSTLYTVNTQPWGPNFGPFRSTTNSFQDITYFIIPIDYHVKRPKRNNNNK